MKSYFESPMGLGRFPQKLRGTVFSHDRQYFDQILYKNMRFRHEYAVAYAEWAKSFGEEVSLKDRILAGIEYTGEDQVEKLFTKVVAIVNREAEGALLPEDIAYRDTLPGGRYAEDPQYAAKMSIIKRFWERLSLPVVREE